MDDRTEDQERTAGETPSAGWYPDPASDHSLRCWNGGEWTDRVTELAPSGHPAEVASEQRPEIQQLAAAERPSMALGAHCEACGESLPEEAQFCEICGHPVAGPTSESLRTGTTSARPEDRASSGFATPAGGVKRRGAKTALFAIIVLPAIGALVLLVVAFGEGRRALVVGALALIIVPVASLVRVALRARANRTRRWVPLLGAVVLVGVVAPASVYRGLTWRTCAERIGPGADLAGCDLSERDLRGANLRGASLQGATLQSVDLRGADLRNADLSDANLRLGDLRNANLEGATGARVRLMEADLSGAGFTRADLHDADLGDADLEGADLVDTILYRADLADTNARDADFRGADLHEADLSDADLEGADLVDTILYRADLAGSRARTADFRGADLHEADLSDAYWPGAKLGCANLPESEVSAVVPREDRAELGCTDLHAANLTNASLRDGQLILANLRGADLREADLQRADLRGADLQSTNLSDTDLRFAELARANLRAADLGEADLQRADLRGADLRTTNLRAANLGYAKLGDADMTDALMLSTRLVRADLSKTNLTGARITAVKARAADFTGARFQGNSLKGSDLRGTIGISDAMLIAALGVELPQLAPTILDRNIVLESSEEISRALEKVCAGQSIAGAGTVQSNGTFVTVSGASYGGEFGAPELPPGSYRAPPALRFTEIVVCVDPEETVDLEICGPYSLIGSGLPASDIVRYQEHQRVRILDPATAAVLAEQTYQGPAPEPCPNTAAASLTAIGGQLTSDQVERGTAQLIADSGR